MSAFLEQLNNNYFWDIDSTHLDETKSRRLIIERVMNYGNIDQIKLIKRQYGDKKIRKIVRNLNYIDPKTLNFISLLFNISKIKFKCYTRRQSTHLYWSY